MYSVLLFICYGILKFLCDNSKLVHKNVIMVFTGIIFLGVIHLSLELSTIQNIITFEICLMLWIMYSKDTFSVGMAQWLKNNKRFIIVTEIIYLVILLYSVINGMGINHTGWGVKSLIGPYEINHALAYELFCYLIINVFYWIEQETFLSYVGVGLMSILIAFKAVRSVFIVVALAWFMAYKTKKNTKKLILFLFASIVLVLLLMETNLFFALIEKTKNSAAIGSATGGRGSIFASSVKALVESENIGSWIWGIGIDNLSKFNMRNILQYIHAHNDFIDAVVQYGILGLGMYVVCFKRMIKKQIGAAIIIFFLAFFNGVYMYPATVVMAPCILAFSEELKIKKIKGGKGVIKT